MAKSKNLIGQYFGRWLVVSLAPKNLPGDVVAWNCVCSCGKWSIIRGTSLMSGNSRSCGCYRDDIASETGKKTWHKNQPNKSDGLVAEWVCYARYRASARKRNLKFTLQFEEFIKLGEQDCYYCGSPPLQRCLHNKTGQMWIYNGVDRVDNNFGYENWNCVTCCGQCNRAKTSMSLEEFYAWIERVYNNRVRQKVTG